MDRDKKKIALLSVLILIFAVFLFAGNVFSCRSKTASALLNYVINKKTANFIGSDFDAQEGEKVDVENVIFYGLQATEYYYLLPILPLKILVDYCWEEEVLLKISLVLDSNQKKTITNLFKDSVKSNNVQRTKILLSLGASPDTIVEKGNPALYASVLNNRIEMARLLINAGADVNITSKKGWNALNVAIFYDFNMLAKLLIESGADITTKSTNIKKSPLWMAAGKGNLEILNVLLSAGVDTNRTIPSKFAGDRPYSVVDHALNKKQYGAARRLIRESGPSGLTDENVMGDPFISNYCLAGVQRELTRRSYQNFKMTRSNPIIVSINSGKNENQTIAVIDAHPELIDAEDETGETPLMAAIDHKQKNVVRYLVEKGCNVNKSDGNGFTPGVLAAEQNSTGIFRLLVNETFDPQLSGCHDDNLFHFLINRDLIEPMKVLIERNVDLNVADSSGSPLQIALSYDNEKGDKFARLLLEAGADPTLRLNSYFKAPATTIRESSGREDLKKLVEEKYPVTKQKVPWVIKKNSSVNENRFHVVSVYEGSGLQGDKASRIPVTVTDHAGPVNLLFISSRPVIWQIQVESGVIIETVFLIGPKLSDITGLSDSTKYTRLTKATAGRVRYKSLKGRNDLLDMIENVKEVVGSRPTTIQSVYRGQNFTIDGETSINFPNPVLDKPPRNRVQLVGDGTVSARGTVLSYGKAGAFSSAMASVPYNAGKWYFEVRINHGDRKNKPGTYTNVGLLKLSEQVGLDSVLPQGDCWLAREDLKGLKGEDVVGVAADLDNSFLYFMINGVWLSGKPGSGNGVPLEVNRDYRAVMTVSADSSEKSDSIIANFGESFFYYPLPAGYLSYDGRQGNATASK